MYLYTKRSDFNYYLPDELIAQTPLAERAGSRLMCLDRATGDIQHKYFSDIEGMLHSGDVLVINSSKVIPCRILGKRPTGAELELLLLKQLGDGTWEAIVRPGKAFKPGSVVSFADGALKCEIVSVLKSGNRIVKLIHSESNIFALLDKIGTVPLPPYITEKLDNPDRYQTIYAKTLGSAAAPTAGLHFTHELMESLKKKGVIVAEVTLHIGLGTFRPVKSEYIADHTMHSESYYIPEETAHTVNLAKRENRRVIAVGTTSLRTLEAATENAMLKSGAGETDIFIHPGYKFRCVDALITNFHLPESTLIMLVSAFAGYDNTMHAYKSAVENKYRFFSFGDAMFISTV